MNKYRAGGPSKATSTTLCQKCLKRGHYTYECSAAQQERPYTSRPSRTEQLLNPKLAPKLSAPLPPETKTTSKAVAEAEMKQKSTSRRESRDRKPRSEAKESTERRRRSRSVSSSSSRSVSTISTNRSRSLSRPPSQKFKSNARDRSPSVSRSRSRPDHHRGGPKSSEEDGRREPQILENRKARDRATRQSSYGYRSRRDSPPKRHHSPDLKVQLRSSDRQRSRSRSPYREPESKLRTDVRRLPPRERSLSPYSQRVAMTKSMNAT